MSKKWGSKSGLLSAPTLILPLCPIGLWRGPPTEIFIIYDEFPPPAWMILQGGLGTFGIPDVNNEWILFKYFLSDRINRMNWICSRFHPETGNSKFPKNPVIPGYIGY
jgi:hypothetical protein